MTPFEQAITEIYKGAMELLRFITYGAVFMACVKYIVA